MPTDEQQSLIEALTRLLEPNPAVAALWLAGSLGKGQGDQYSDVDLLVLISGKSWAEASAAIVEALPSAATPVLVNRLYGGRVVSVVTDDWRRFDLSFVEPGDLARYNALDLKQLFNKGALTPPTRPEVAYRTSAETLLPIVQEFLRVLGMLVGAMGREEYELGLTGVDLLRRMTLDLMLEENSISPSARGGALRRNPFLTAEQRAALAAIPSYAPDRRSLIAVNRALAAIFLPRARRLAAEIGMAWPEALEEATRRNLRLRLQLEI